MKAIRHTTNKRYRLLALTLSILLLGLVLGTALHSHSAKAIIQEDEYQVKAAFIYNFIAFTQWPDYVEPETFNVCVYGVDYFQKEIDALEEKKVNDLAIQIKRIHQLNEIAQCQVLFISRSHNEKIPAILDKIREQPILTIADSLYAAALGVMINMHLEQNKVKFEVNLKSARIAGLNISSRLLQLATQVYQ